MDNIDGVLVVGGGVVGLTVALKLARNGVPVTVFEGETDLVEEYRASTFHPPTLEMLNQLGVAEDLIANGLIADKVQYRDRVEGVIAEFDLGVLKNDTPYPFRLQVEQYALAVLLLSKLRQEPNVEIQFSHKVTDVKLENDYVIATVHTPDGVREYRATYLVGSDGAKSTVRHALGIKFTGLTYTERYLVTFTTFDFQSYLPDLAYVNYVSGPGEWYVLLRSPGLWRVLFPTTQEESEADSETLGQIVQARYQRVIATGEPYPILYQGIYTVHQRIADSYRKGNAFLAGDAAHLNNPLGGMGLNGGIHDSFSLGEKLSIVWNGEADDSVLDTYAYERKHIASEHIMKQTHQNRSDISETDEEARKKHQEEMKQTALDHKAAYQHALKISMIQGTRETGAQRREP